jgi:glycosyltransferase involved in cell wall biosynthesis
MAVLPYFVLGPNALLSLTGLSRGPDRTTPTPAEDWRGARVDVVIPAFNEADTIALCLAALLRQTMRPRRVILVDDGSTDGTIESAKAFCARTGLELVAIQRARPIGKTPTIKRQARELDSDVEFVLDGDTVLESPNYIERAVQELYQGVGIASACGTILPMRRRDRRAFAGDPAVWAFGAVEGVPQPVAEEPLGRAFLRGVTNVYRETLYLFLQRFIYRGQMVFFGTITNPVGCAVAYRREYVEALFNRYSPLLGDDLTNSEDIFIGMALLDEGYRNIQLTDVYARTVEPLCHRLPKQVYLWSSSYLQSCFYFDALLRSPVLAVKRWLGLSRPGAQGAPLSAGAPVPALAAAGAVPADPRQMDALMRTATAGAGASTAGGADVATIEAPAIPLPERRRVREQYRQPFGREHTRQSGRPVGWLLAAGLVEKIFFPIALLLMLVLAQWEALLVTIGFESLIALAALVIVMKGQRAQYFVKGLAVMPLRYLLIASELVTLGRFASDLWITRNRKWRK